MGIGGARIGREGYWSAETLFWWVNSSAAFQRWCGHCCQHFIFLNPEEMKETPAECTYFSFLFLWFVPSSYVLNYFSIVILPPEGKIQVCESWGQCPSKAPEQADELLWSIPEPTTHWLWLSRACSHKQIIAENLSYIASDLCFQLE